MYNCEYSQQQQAMQQACHIMTNNYEQETVCRSSECIYIHVVDTPTRKPPANEHARNRLSSRKTCTYK